VVNKTRHGLSIMEFLAALFVWSIAATILVQWMSITHARNRHAHELQRAAAVAKNLLASIESVPAANVTNALLEQLAQEATAALPENDGWTVTGVMEASPANNDSDKPVLQTNTITVRIVRNERPNIDVAFTTFRHTVLPEKQP
jgi:Tfp pilus assembly protein PilV